MIQTRQITLDDGGILVETYSDAGFMIRQDETGALYDRAADPVSYPRTYTETDIPCETEEMEEKDAEPSAETILNILLGGTE